MVNYPGNSRKARDEEPNPKKIEKVVTGKVVRRQKSLGKRFVETFVGGEGSGGVLSYIVQDVLIPAAKDTITDVVTQGIERTLYGEVRRGSGLRSRSNSPYTTYNRYSSAQSPLRREDPRAREPMSRRGRATHDFDEIVLDTRAEADEVIDKMFATISQYDAVTVADLYEMVGLAGSFTDEKFGWTNLSGAGVTRVKGGYLLNLPRTEALD